MGQHRQKPSQANLLEVALVALVGSALGAALYAAKDVKGIDRCIPFAISAMLGLILALRDYGLLSLDEHNGGGDGGGPPPPPPPSSGMSLDRLVALASIGSFFVALVSLVLDQFSSGTDSMN